MERAELIQRLQSIIDKEIEIIDGVWAHVIDVTERSDDENEIEINVQPVFYIDRWVDGFRVPAPLVWSVHVNEYHLKMTRAESARRERTYRLRMPKCNSGGGI